jgi:hypothetical protein
MPKKKQAKKKAARPTEKRKKRSQRGNDSAARAGRPAPAPRRVAKEPGESGVPRRTICSNAECKLRRAACYGHEACPGFKGRSE